MKFYESQTLERIGFDFYCDIANNIVKARKEKQLTQEELATKANIRLSRLSGIENVKIRLDLDDLKKLSRTLDVSVDWLINADLDSQYGECLYLIWPESMPDFKLYKKATSKRMAFLLYDLAFKEAHVRYNSSLTDLSEDCIQVEIESGMTMIQWESLSDKGKLLVDSWHLGLTEINKEYGCIEFQ